MTLFSDSKILIRFETLKTFSQWIEQYKFFDECLSPGTMEYM